MDTHWWECKTGLYFMTTARMKRQAEPRGCGTEKLEFENQKTKREEKKQPVSHEACTSRPAAPAASLRSLTKG